MKLLDQIDLHKIFSQERIFEKDPSSDGLYIYLSIIFGILIILSVVLKLAPYFKSNYPIKNVWHKLAVMLVTSGGIGLVLIFARYEEIPYLGSRLMILLLFGMFIIWILSIVYYWRVTIPREMEIVFKKEKFEKYLPRGKAGLPRPKKRLAKN